MDAEFAEREDAARYAKRHITVEPAFGQMELKRGYRTRTRRSRQPMETDLHHGEPPQEPPVPESERRVTRPMTQPH